MVLERAVGQQRLQPGHKLPKVQRRTRQLTIAAGVSIKELTVVIAARTLPTLTPAPTLSPVSAVKEKAAHASRARENDHVRRDRDATGTATTNYVAATAARARDVEATVPSGGSICAKGMAREHFR